MNKFNLTFHGEILSGHDPEQVKLRFAKMFSIDDPVRLEKFFSGQSIILRRNLDRKAAAELFQNLRTLGVVAELVKITAGEAAPEIATAPAPPSKPKSEKNKKTTGAGSQKAPKADPKPANHREVLEEKIPPRQPGDVQQAWPVSSNRKNKEKKHPPLPSSPAPLNKKNQQTAIKVTQKQAREEEARRAAQEKDTRKKEELAEKENLAAEQLQREQAQSARLQAEQDAEKAERERLAHEESQRLEAIRKKKERQVAEEAATRKALEEKAVRLKAEKEKQRVERVKKKTEEAARLKAELEEARRRKAAEEARLQAALEKRRAEEAAIRNAAEEIQRKRRAEEAAKRKAQEEAEKKRIAEDAARRKAEQKAKERARQKREAEEAARRRAEVEEEKRRRAEEAARVQAQLEEIKRQEVREEKRLQAELAEIQRQEAEDEARLKAELEEKEKQATAEAARIKAEATRKKTDAKRKSKERQRAAAKQETALRAQQKTDKSQQKKHRTEEAAQTKAAQHRAELQEEEEQADQREAMEEKAVQRAARELAQQASIKTTRTQVKTNLDVPHRKKALKQATDTAARRKQQAGAANLYRLRPFRNTPEIQARSEQARKRMRQSFALGGVALAALLVLAGVFLRAEQPSTLLAASAVAIDKHSQPLLLAGDWLLMHDRSGVSAEKLSLSELGVHSLVPPLVFDDQGTLIAMGRLLPSSAASQEPQPSNDNEQNLQLLRCKLEQRQCSPLAPAFNALQFEAFVLNPINGNLLLADTAAGELIKTSSSGQVLASAKISLPNRPTLRLHSGLLLANSPHGPAVSVYRYDERAFGQQLDEILLLPPAAVIAKQTTVSDFLFSGGSWWASLHNPDDGSVGLYRFDEAWNYLSEAPLTHSSLPLQLASWGDKTLVNNQREAALQRFNDQGAEEVPMTSELLTTLIDEKQSRGSLAALAWLSALLLCAATALVGISFAYLQRLRALVYRSHRERGAEPVDKYATTLHWIDPAAARSKQLRVRLVSYGIFAFALVLVAMGQSVSLVQLICLLLVLSGPALTLGLLSRHPIGHIGVADGTKGSRLILVDHRGIYHFGEGSGITYRGRFVLVDDVVVFTGNRLLPAFAADQVQQLITPLATGGIKVDRNTLLVKLLEARHPLALGSVSVLASVVAALLLLGFYGFFPG
ncbi:MAG: hypothetical protein ACI9JM_000358 [Halioglobus sp.]